MKFKGESAEYRKLRDELLEAEIALKDQRERVAVLRRQLPMSSVVETDYIFREGPSDIRDESPANFRDVRLSQLFAPGKDRLIIDHMMWAANDKLPCPMCNMWADGYAAIAPHVSNKVNFSLVAKIDLATLRGWARSRGWNKGGGRQRPGVSVFSRAADGKIYHFYTTEASLGQGHHRGIDLFSPVWNHFDLLPEGREDWMPKHSY